MLDHIVMFYDHLPGAVKWFVSIVFNIIIVRGLIAQEISGWIRQKGIVKVLRRCLKATLPNYARHSAIWVHRRDHKPVHPLQCNQTRCSILQTT